MTENQKKFVDFLKSKSTEDSKLLVESIEFVYNSLFEGDEEIPEDDASESIPESEPEDTGESMPESEPEDTGAEEALPEAVHVGEPVEVDANTSFINELNGDLEREYMAAIQYIQHASMITGPQYASVITELLKHADEEMGHAKLLADRINYLGGVPIATMTPAKTGVSTTVMLTQDKEGEEDAIARYTTRIQEAESLKDFGTKQILIDILEDEEEHRNDLIVFLGQ